MGFVSVTWLSRGGKNCYRNSGQRRVTFDPAKNLEPVDEGKL
jgi:hypothetical protein